MRLDISLSSEIRKRVDHRLHFLNSTSCRQTFANSKKTSVLTCELVCPQVIRKEADLALHFINFHGDSLMRRGPGQVTGRLCTPAYGTRANGLVPDLKADRFLLSIRLICPPSPARPHTHTSVH